MSFTWQTILNKKVTSMIKSKVIRFLSVAALVVGFSTVAHAQATRTWISGVGDDANPCSRTAPCKTFAGAISKTAAAGEINVLDPGGFGAVTITKAITLRSDHIEAGVLVSGTNAIIVSAGVADQVVLEGLDIEGLGTGLAAVKVNSGAAVYVIRCMIHHFAGNGVDLTSSTANGRVFVKDSNIIQNAGGVNVQGNGVANIGSISNTLIDGNSSFALKATGAGNLVAVFTSILTNSPAGISLVSGGTAISFGPSNVVGGTGAFTTTIPYK
jgi:hypothetical protein